MKADLHVHSKYSHRPSAWILRKIGGAESYTEPAAVYRYLKQIGMDRVTLTDTECKPAPLQSRKKNGTFDFSNPFSTFLPHQIMKKSAELISEEPTLAQCLKSSSDGAPQTDATWFRYVQKTSNAIIHDFADEILFKLLEADIFYLLNTVSTTASSGFTDRWTASMSRPRPLPKSWRKKGFAGKSSSCINGEWIRLFFIRPEKTDLWTSNTAYPRIRLMASSTASSTWLKTPATCRNSKKAPGSIWSSALLKTAF